MFFVWMILLALWHGACLALVLLGLPGTWILLGSAALVDALTPADLFSARTIWMGVVLALLGEALEFFAGAQGAKRAGAGRRGTRGALIGGIAGAIVGGLLLPIPLVGSLVGATVGAFGLATWAEHGGGQSLPGALRAGGGAAAGQVTGMLLKFSVGVAVWLILTVASFS